ncbi:MAG: hypothetical protein QW291_07205 [Thermofilaceae archaeon]
MVNGSPQDVDCLILLVLKYKSKPIERRLLHKYLYHLTSNNLNLKEKLTFFGSQPFSLLVDDRLKELVKEGLVKPLYIVGPIYTELYRDYYVLTEKGSKFLASQRQRLSEVEDFVKQYMEDIESETGEDVERSAGT